MDFYINENWNEPEIEGVFYKKLTSNVDSRGDLTEIWSQPWSDKEGVASEIKHVYFNTTHQGVTKAWHVHEHTVSQYTCVQGKMQVVLIDLREGSITYGRVDKFLIGTHTPSLIKIPSGVLKGWKSLAGDSVIVNLLTSADVSDNKKISWDTYIPEIWEPKNG